MLRVPDLLRDDVLIAVEQLEGKAGEGDRLAVGVIGFYHLDTRADRVVVDDVVEGRAVDELIRLDGPIGARAVSLRCGGGVLVDGVALGIVGKGSGDVFVAPAAAHPRFACVVGCRRGDCFGVDRLRVCGRRFAGLVRRERSDNLARRIRDDLESDALSGGLQTRPVGSCVEVFDDFEIEGGDVVGRLQGLEIDDALVVHVRSVDRVRLGRAVEFVSSGSLRLGDDDGAQGDIAD